MLELFLTGEDGQGNNGVIWVFGEFVRSLENLYSSATRFLLLVRLFLWAKAYQRSNF
jgi:hypothetical protein